MPDPATPARAGMGGFVTPTVTPLCEANSYSIAVVVM